MKIRTKLINLIIILVIALSSCKKEEKYEEKNVKIESVFDNLKDDKDNKIDEKNNKESDIDTTEVEEVEFFILQRLTELRSTPEFSDNVVDEAESGSEIEVIEKNIGPDNDWAKIIFEYKIYYVEMDSLY